MLLVSPQTSKAVKKWWAKQDTFLSDFYEKPCYHSIGRAAEGIWSLSMYTKWRWWKKVNIYWFFGVSVRNSWTERGKILDDAKLGFVLKCLLEIQKCKMKLGLNNKDSSLGKCLIFCALKWWCILFYPYKFRGHLIFALYNASCVHWESFKKMYQSYTKSCFLQKSPACVVQESMLQGRVTCRHWGSVLNVDLNLQNCIWSV